MARATSALYVLVVLMACLMSVPGTARAADTMTLTVYTWHDYIDPAIVAAFEKKHGARIIISTFSDDNQREEALLLSQGRGFDIVCLNEAYMMADNMPDWVAPLDLSQLPNLRHVEYPLVGIAPQAKRYGVPYFWGSAGIAYRTDLMTTAPSRWRDLFTLAPQYSGKIVQPSTLRLLMGIGLLANGADFNSESEADLQQVSELLLKQMPHVFGYETSNVGENNALVTGEAVMAPMFNGDLLVIKDLQPNVAFVYPEEGGNIWADFLVVSRSSTNKALAFQFLNYLNDPEVARDNAEYVNFATANMAARALASEEYRNNPVIFPSAEQTAKMHVIKPVSTKTLRLQNEIFVRTLTRFAMRQQGH